MERPLSAVCFGLILLADFIRFGFDLFQLVLKLLPTIIHQVSPHELHVHQQVLVRRTCWVITASLGDVAEADLQARKKPVVSIATGAPARRERASPTRQGLVSPVGADDETFRCAVRHLAFRRGIALNAREEISPI
jgi:hypothetical protein